MKRTPLSQYPIFAGILVTVAFAAGGCLDRPHLDRETVLFSPPPLTATNGAVGGPVLGVRSLRISPPFDGRSLIYRTGEFSFERDPYAGFLGSPAEGLMAPVCGLLRVDGGFGAVVEPGSRLKPDILAEINVDQLYGDIRNPKQPAAVLAVRVTFLNATNGLPGSVIRQRYYSRRIPLRSASASGLMAGWDRALAEIFAEATSDFRHGTPIAADAVREKGDNTK